MFTRILKFRTLLFLAAALAVFTACEKEDVVTTEEPVLTEDFTVTERGIVLGPHGDRLQCYQLVYPVTVVFPDETTEPAEANGPEALKQILMNWRAANPAAADHPRLAFPYEVELRDGTVATVETAEDVVELREDCRVSRPHRPTKCFRLIYPVTVNMPDGTTREADSAENLHLIFKTWQEENPDSEERPEIAFPYQVELRNGAVITVESVLHVRDLPRGCRETPPPPCFQLIYPVTLVFPGADGVTVEVANIQAMDRVMREWRENYPDAVGRPEVLFPYDVRLRDGTLTTIENEEDLREVLDGCRDGRPFRPKCFRLTFPVTLEYPGGRTETVENRLELHLRIWKWTREHPFSPMKPQVTFPFTVQFRDGSTATVNNRDELLALREQCRG